MIPGFLIPEVTVQEGGEGPVLDVTSAAGETLQLTLGITRSLEQESIELTILGSPDGTNWNARPVASFPQKFYCGTYSIFVDLTRTPDVRFLKASWKLNRWGRGSLKPLFSIYLFAAVHVRMARRVAAAATQ